MKLLRRSFSFAAATIIIGCSTANTVPRPTVPLHPIRHVVIVMQENRSFDNIFAGFPGADTTLTGACKEAPWCKTGTITLHSVTLETTGHLGLGKDIDHSHHGFEVECDVDGSGICRNDGFDKIGFGEAGTGLPAKTYPYAYIERSESKAYWDFAARYALADHMFFSETAASFISHQMILTGSVALSATESLTDQPDAMPWGCDAPQGAEVDVLLADGREIYAPHKGLPFPCFEYKYIGGKSMADLLDAANVSWTYYVAPINGDFSGKAWDGFDAIAKVRCASFTPPESCHGEGADWKAHMSFPNTTFFTDLKNGLLPSVSWLIPTFADSDHPASGCNHGPRWVTKIIDAVGRSKYWDSTAIVLLWDDWGGWYDNVPPMQSGYTSLGFRVPMIVISPWARPRSISSTQYDFGSVLKFVEENFGLASLHTTDESATSIGNMFDFTQKPRAFVNEPLPSQKPCPSSATVQDIIDHDGGVPE